MEDHILMKLTAEKNRRISEFIKGFLGHTPSPEEKKQFTLVHSLGESRIYFRGRLVAHLKYDIHDPSAY